MLDTHQPLIPSGLNLAWRPLQAGDQAAVRRLTAAVIEADGGLPLAMTDEFLQGRYFSAPSTLGAWDHAGGLLACAAVQIATAPHEQRALIVGQVHPAVRRRGLGTFLIDWSVTQARALLAAKPSDQAHLLCIASESLNEGAERLYAKHGFTQQFGELVMRHTLEAPLPAAVLQDDITLVEWSVERADLFFEAYGMSFRDRPGFPGWNAQQWIEWVAADDDFLPALSLLAIRDGRAVGFIVCSAGWIVQVGVRPEQRGRGVASGLVAEVLRRFRASGADQVLLDVNMNNPSAERVYARLGFGVIGRRARYVAPA